MNDMVFRILKLSKRFDYSTCQEILIITKTIALEANILEDAFSITMKRYYWLFIAFVLWFTVFAVVYFRNNHKLSHLLWKELSWWVISFYYSNHSSWGYGDAYTILVEDNVPYLKVSIDNLAFRMPEFSGIDKIDEWVYVETFELKQNILKELEKLVNKHKIWEWEGSYRNDRVLDWDSWSFSIKFGNGEMFSAYGYMG